MRRALVLFLTSSFAVPLPAQQSSSQATTIQMQCHDLATTGNYVAPDEIVINGQACKQISVNAQPSSPAAVVPAVQPTGPTRSDAPPSQPPAPAAEAPTPRGFLLEDGTPVHLVFSQTVSSAAAQTGDMIELEVVDDVVVNGLLVIPHGSTAWATVTDAEHKRHLGRPGKLDMNIDKVRLADGEKVLLRAVKDAQGGGHTGAMTGAMVATSLVLLPAAPLFLFMHGKDVTVPQGTAITAFVQGDVRLDANNFQKELVISK